MSLTSIWERRAHRRQQWLHVDGRRVLALMPVDHKPGCYEQAMSLASLWLRRAQSQAKPPTRFLHISVLERIPYINGQFINQSLDYKLNEMWLCCVPLPELLGVRKMQTPHAFTDERSTCTDCLEARRRVLAQTVDTRR